MDRHRRSSQRLGGLWPFLIAPALLIGCSSSAGKLRSGAGEEPASGARRADTPALAAARRLEAIREDPNELHAFFLDFPKGGDLHHHFNGSFYAETLIDAAIRKELCIDAASLQLAACESGDELQPVASFVAYASNYDAIVDALSLSGASTDPAAAREKFFSILGKFRPVLREPSPRLLSVLRKRAAAENVQYIESMIWTSRELFGIVNADPYLSRWDGDMDKFFDVLAANEAFNALIARSVTQVRDLFAGSQDELNCDRNDPPKACQVDVRFLHQIYRNSQPNQVFSKIIFSYLFAARSAERGPDPRLVGVNIVGREDTQVSRRDYRLHMEMFRYVQGRVPGVNLSLHAGEMAAGQVPPEDLQFHVRDAVERARARRIGHGVDIRSETCETASGPVSSCAHRILSTMADGGVVVEVPLTSNELLLGVRGADHPLPLYVRSGVPVVLATDDAGIFRTQLTREFVLAAMRYPALDYDDFKRFARNSLHFSFAPGKSLWRDAGYSEKVPECAGAPASAAACSELLQASPKAQLQWRLEEELAAFEARFRSRRHP